MDNRKYDCVGTMNFRGITLYRVRAARSFGSVKVGTVGGWIASRSNLSDEGECWISDSAKVYGDAAVKDNAVVCDNAKVYGRAKVYGDATVCGNAEVSDEAQVCGNAFVQDNVKLSNNVKVFKDMNLTGNESYVTNARLPHQKKVIYAKMS